MKWIIRAGILPLWLAWLAIVSHAAAESLPHAKPEEVGLSSERLGRLTQTLRTNIAAGEIPGAVLLIARHGKIAYFESLGLLDPQAKTPMREDAIFRIYSMSKPITTVAAMMLFEDARLTLSEPVGKYLPALAKMRVATDNKPDPEADPHKISTVPADRPISIQDLMRRRAKTAPHVHRKTDARSQHSLGMGYRFQEAEAFGSSRHRNQIPGTGEIPSALDT